MFYPPCQNAMFNLFVCCVQIILFYCNFICLYSLVYSLYWLRFVLVPYTCLNVKLLHCFSASRPHHGHGYGYVIYDSLSRNIIAKHVL